MNKNDLINELNSFKTAERAHRDKSAKFVSDHPETFPFLVEIVFEDQKRINIKAAWVFELVCFEKISLLALYLDFFTQNLSKIKDESCLRPIAKVCFFIAKAYYNSTENEIHKNLSVKNLEYIVENNFDWLIEEHKVATKVFAMDTLYYLGKEFDWIHAELELILQKNTPKESAGYKAHARSILKII